jgi:hypothetical protein
LASATEAIIPPSIAAPSTGGPAAKSDTKRLIVEVCCHPNPNSIESGLKVVKYYSLQKNLILTRWKTK